MKANTPIAEFKFGDSQQGQPSTVIGAIKVDTYLVSYNDGNGKPQTRLVFKLPGKSEVFMLQERISGINVATSAHEWFSRALDEKLKVGKVDDGNDSVESV